MTTEEALERLPAAHAAALRLDGAGAGVAAIAVALDIEPEGVAPLLEVARAKLRRVQASVVDPV